MRNARVIFFLAKPPDHAMKAFAARAPPGRGVRPRGSVSTVLSHFLMQPAMLLGPWGILPLGVLLGATAATCWGAACYPRGGGVERLLAGTTCLFAWASFGTRSLALVGVCAPGPLLGGLVAFVLAGLALARQRRAWPTSHLTFALGPKAWPARALRPPPGREAWPASGPAALALRGAGVGAMLVAAGVSFTAAFAAYYLPIWQYDALSYHLPFVQFVLQDGTSRAVPAEIPYLGSYPHAVEWAFVLLRALLPDDRLVDLAQLPFGLAGAAATYGIARTLGARRPLAAVAAASWLALPAVFLQLPTNYVDVASASFYLLAAFFLLQPPSPAPLVLAGLAAGLFLGSKPSAPLPFALLAIWALYRARPAGPKAVLALAFAGLAAMVLGAESYVSNLVLYRNPVWPVALDVGPVHLPGSVSLDRVLSSGAGTERVTGPLAWRMIASWARLDAAPSFDMRVGGLSVAALAALAALPFWLVRRRSLGLAVLALGALASPDPALVRYVLALPALAFAASASAASAWRVSAQALAATAALASAVASAVFAAGGLAGEGPPLAAYRGMSRAERDEAIGPEGRPTLFVRLRGRLAEGEAIGIDRSFEARHLLWRPDLSTRVVYLPAREGVDAQFERIARERVRFVIVGNDSPLVRAAGTRWNPLFHCRAAPCAAYEVL